MQHFKNALHVGNIYMKTFIPLSILLVLLLSGCATPASKKTIRQAHLSEFKNHWLGDSELDKADKKYALETWVYSVVADRSYLEDETLCLPLNEQWREIIVDKEKFSNLLDNGFYAQAWHRSVAGNKKELIITFRGTDGSGDFKYANFRFFRTKDDKSQFTSALTFRDLVLEKASANPDLDHDYIVFVGHSLGGGLAQYAQDFTENSKAYSFNGSPNRGRLFSLGKPHEEVRNATRVYEKGEVLRPLRWLLFDFDPYKNANPGEPGMNTRWIDFYKDSLIANHNMKDFSTALTRLAAFSGDMEAEKVIDYMRERQPDNIEKHATFCSIAGTLKVN
jgi:pimeloyl-ACP methyl ester carboxylesterase